MSERVGETDQVAWHKQETQWGVSFCGGEEVDGPMSRDQAEAMIAACREQIEADPAVADDYEPMTLVERTHRVQVTPWLEPRGSVAPDQDLINAATVIQRIATRENRHPDTAAILLPIAEELRSRALAERVRRPGCANYAPPVTCLTAPSSETGRCDHCQEVARG